MHNSYLKRDTSSAIKGVALISMFIHHFFTFPEWYVDGISYPYLLGIVQYLYAPLKMCIPVFAFLTGYFYFFTKHKTLRYSLRKATDLLVSHWVVCLFMMAIALVLGKWKLSGSGILIELFGAGSDIMLFSWYVTFYCAAILMLPVIDKLSSGHLGGDLLLLVILPAAAVLCLKVTMVAQFHINIHIISTLLDGVYEWFPCIAMGYVTARYRLFETYFDGLTEKFSSKAGHTFLHICMFCIGFAGRLALPRFRLGGIHPAGEWTDLIMTMDVLYAPLIVYSLAKLLDAKLLRAPKKVLDAVGRQSMYLWFLHAIFFNCCKEITQPLIYAPRNPILVLVFALAVCYIVSIPLDKITKSILKLKNRFL